MSLIQKSRTDAKRKGTRTTEELPSWAYDDKGAPLVIANGSEPVKPVTESAKPKSPPVKVNSRKMEAADYEVTVRYLFTEQIKPNPFQPRRHFAEDELEELAASLREHGQLQPILVRPYKGGFQIIAGERRWRAAQRIPGFKLVCIVRPLNDMETLVASWHENHDRVSVRALDSAFFMVRFGLLTMGKSAKEIETAQKTGELPEDFPFEAVGQQTGMSARSVRRYTDLLKLSGPMRTWFDKVATPAKESDDKKAFVPTEKHGRALLLLRDNPSAQKQLVKEIESGSLSGDAAIAKAGTLKPNKVGLEPSGSKPKKQSTALEMIHTAVSLVTSVKQQIDDGKLTPEQIDELTPEWAKLKDVLA